MKFCGRDFRVGFWDGTTFTPITGERTSSLSIVNETVDTTGKGDMQWREARNCGLRSLDVSLDGHVTDAAMYGTLVSRSLTGSIDRYRIVSGSGEAFDFYAQVQAHERSGDHNAAEAYALKLVSTKIVNYVSPMSGFEGTRFTAQWNGFGWSSPTPAGTVCSQTVPVGANSWVGVSGGPPYVAEYWSYGSPSTPTCVPGGSASVQPTPPACALPDPTVIAPPEVGEEWLLVVNVFKNPSHPGATAGHGTSHTHEVKGKFGYAVGTLYKYSPYLGINTTLFSPMANGSIGSPYPAGTYQLYDMRFKRYDAVQAGVLGATESINWTLSRGVLAPTSMSYGLPAPQVEGYLYKRTTASPSWTLMASVTKTNVPCLSAQIANPYPSSPASQSQLFMDQFGTNHVQVEAAVPGAYMR